MCVSHSIIVVCDERYTVEVWDERRLQTMADEGQFHRILDSVPPFILELHCAEDENIPLLCVPGTDVGDADGNPLLLVATNWGNQSIINSLVLHGANMFAQNSAGETALHRSEGFYPGHGYVCLPEAD